MNALLDRPCPPEIVDDLTRRHFLAGAAAAAALAACGRSADDPGAAADGPAAGGFPVTIEHLHGSTTIADRPQRVVTIGLTEQDALLALGVVPVGTTEWLGNHPGAVHPWALDALGDAPVPEVLSGEGIAFERVAALRPDLILGLYNVEVDRPDYQRLAQIAPTVLAPPGETVASISWQDLTRIVGRAVGRAPAAEELIDGVERRLAAVRAMHPAFSTSTSVNVYPTPDGTYQAYPPPDLGGQLLASLGFATPAGVLTAAQGRSSVDLSREQVELLDADIVVWLVDDAAAAEEQRADPLYSRLAVATEGRHVFLDYDTDRLAAAMSFQTVLSVPFLVDGLVPRLVAALDGDPATATGPAGRG